MNVHLSADLEKFIEEQVASGSYNSMSEVVKEALMLLRDQHHLREQRVEQLKREINKGLEDVKHGRTTDSRVVYKRLKTRIAEWGKKSS